MWSMVGAVIILGLGWKIFHTFRAEVIRKKARTEALFENAVKVLADARLEQQSSYELPRLIGHYGGLPVQVKPVIDTLATRRLPALWLLVTLQSPLPVGGRFNMMMRPAGPTTFSNFDLMPHTLEHPPGFPEQAVIRTDDAETVLPPDIIRPHVAIFSDGRAKELLVTENGVRLVWLLAEAERARYGIFRQAEFGEVKIDAGELTAILDILLDIRQAVLRWNEEKP